MLRLALLLLVRPATNTTHERSFFAKKLSKTFLRDTITRNRLNHCIILHVHCETGQPNMVEVSNDFIDNNQVRLKLSGYFRGKCNTYIVKGVTKSCNIT